MNRLSNDWVPERCGRWEYFVRAVEAAVTHCIRGALQALAVGQQPADIRMRGGAHPTSGSSAIGLSSTTGGQLRLFAHCEDPLNFRATESFH